MPAFAREILHFGPEKAGLLLMFAGVGSLLGNGTLAVLGDIKWKNLILLAGALMYGLSILFFSFNHWPFAAFGIMLFLGMGRMVFVSLGTTLIQLMVPKELLGRASSLWQGGVALRLVGTIYMGFLGDHIGQRIVMAAGAVCYLIAFSIVGLVNPAIRKLEQPKKVKGPEEQVPAGGVR